MVGREIERVETTHRQACHGTVTLVGLHAVVSLHILDNIGEGLLVESVHRVRQVERRLCEGSGLLAWSRLLRDIAIGHDDNHRHSLPLRYQVVHDLSGTAQFAPSLFVATHAVQQIEHGIALLFGGICNPAVIISRRRIDGHAARHVGRRRGVPHLLHGAMRNVAHHVGAFLGRSDEEDAHHGVDIANLIDVQRIVDTQAVDVESIIIKFGREGLRRGVLPYAILSLCHRHSLLFLHKVAREHDTLGFGSFQAECHGVVAVDLRRLQGALPPFERLLCRGTQRRYGHQGQYNHFLHILILD